MSFRIGIGQDTHRLGANRPLLIGGVEVAHTSGLIGHSDADVLLHAVTDAFLGAVAKGDIGEWFPDDDPANLNRDSKQMLTTVLRQALPAGWSLVNLDCTVFAQRPKLSPYKQAIRGELARLLDVSIERINVKAKTGEKVGPIGREEAISAEAAVLIQLD